MGSAHLFKVGRIWYGWAYTLDGKQRRFSCRTDDRETAKAVLRARAKRIVGADNEGPPPSYTVGQALAYYLAHGVGNKAKETQEFYAKKAGTLRRVMGSTEVQDLSEAVVREYISQRIAEKVSHHTINKEMVTLRQALKLVKKRKELKLNIDVGEIVPHYDARYVPRTRRLTTTEFGLLMSHLKPNRRLWVMVAVLGGGRLSEVNRLEWEHIDLAGRWIHWGTKTPDSRRAVPIHPTLLREFRLTKNRKGLVCPWKEPASGIRTACRVIGLPHASPNDLRRTFISWLKEGGEDSFLVAKLAGHSSSKMIDEVYGHLSTKAYQTAIKGLPVVGYRSDRKKSVLRTSRTAQKNKLTKSA